MQELLKKCHQCMETIVKAKDQQAAEANKNASILLKELDLEKVGYLPQSSLALWQWAGPQSNLLVPEQYSGKAK